MRAASSRKSHQSDDNTAGANPVQSPTPYFGAKKPALTYDLALIAPFDTLGCSRVWQIRNGIGIFRSRATCARYTTGYLIAAPRDLTGIQSVPIRRWVARIDCGLRLLESTAV